MSLDSQLTRVSQGTKDTLKAIINKLGGNVGDEMIDQYPDLANALANIGDLSSGAIPSSEKGVAAGVATLGQDGKVLSEQLPKMDYANSTHASQHARGGTDWVTLANIAFLGANPITSTADDTTTNWWGLGSGYAFYTMAGQLTGQPSTFGMLINYAYGSDVMQLFKDQPSGALYIRGGNATGWGQPWTKLYDTLNKPTAEDVGAADSNHNHSASDITSGTLPAARGGTGQTTITPAVGTKGVRQIYAGTSDMTAGSTSLSTGVLYFVYE